MGLKSKEPGMKRFSISPCIDDDIDFIEISVPTPSGFIDLKYEKRASEKLIEFKAPKCIEIELDKASKLTLKRI